MNFPSKSDIESAHLRIAPYIHRTPILTSSSINEILGCTIYFKCENFQKVGAFKMRGATNAICSLSHNQLKNGVATHSSGNHAQALALAAKNANTKAFIVMPSNAPAVKVAAVKGYGAKVIFCEPTLEARESGLAKVVSETGAVFIHPYDNWEIIAGQATAAKELIEDMPHCDYLMTPVGGGGLLAGSALSIHYFSSQTKVIAAEPKGADDAHRSFAKGEIIPSKNPQTIADGLLTSLGKRNFEVIQKHVDDIITCEEESISSAMKLIWERMKIIIEPSGAVPLAALMENSDHFKNQKVGVVISGGNLDIKKLPF